MAPKANQRFAIRTSAALSRCTTTVSARRIIRTTGQELRYRTPASRAMHSPEQHSSPPGPPTRPPHPQRRQQPHQDDHGTPTSTRRPSPPDPRQGHPKTHRISLDPSGVSHTADPPTGANAKSRHHPTDTTNNANHPRKHANNTPLPVNDTRLCRPRRTGPHLLLYVLQFRQYGGQQTPSSSERVAHAVAGKKAGQPNPAHLSGLW